VSVSIGTLALCALRGFSQAISNFVRLGEIEVLRGNVSVGRTAASDFNIDALVVEMVSVENEIDAGPTAARLAAEVKRMTLRRPGAWGLPAAACFSQKPSSIWSCSTLIA